GGTKVQAIVADSRHRIVGAARHPTPTTGGADAVVDTLIAAVTEAAELAGVPTGEKTVLFKLMKDRGRDRLTAGIWNRALADGDKVARKVIDRAYAALGAGVASAVNLLDVEAV